MCTRDPEGKLVAQGLTLPCHLGSIPTALEVIVERFGADMQAEDIYIMNDPFDGGMHLPDIFIFKPIFIDDERQAFAATICHHTDVGGRVAGSNASDSTEIYQEGLRIPPLKLYDAGKRNETMFELIEKNVRLPDKVFGDLRAQLAACHIAEKQFLDLVTRYGKPEVVGFMQATIDYAERLTRSAIATLDDGTFSFEDWIDDDGVERDQPIRLFVTVTKQGDSIKVDWNGSSDQVKGAINSTLSFTRAASYTAIRSILSGDIPNNEGVFRAIEVIAPPGSIANCVLPAAVAARSLTGFRMLDCIFGALSKMVPDKVFAASDGGNSGVCMGGYDADRKPFIFLDFICGSWGGRPWADGLEGNSNMFANMAAQSIELAEAENPIQILSSEFVIDGAGPGKFRGGVPYRRDYRFLENEATLQVRSDRCRIRPYGLYGGWPGSSSANWLNPHSENRKLPSKLTQTIRQGDVFRHQLAGGGGWGDPLLRDPELVLKDVRNEMVSMTSAREDYGVAVDTRKWKVDWEITDMLRKELRVLREAFPLSGDEWKDLAQRAAAAR